MTATRIGSGLATLALAALAATAACSPSAPESSESPPAFEAPALGLRLAPIPSGYSRPLDSGGRLELGAALGGVPGEAAIWIEPREGAVNLVAEARRWGESAAAAPGGAFHGGNELATGYGPAYSARAAVDGGTVEERRTFLLHPDGSERLLVVSLRYPPGDAAVSRARLEQALELVAAIEPLDGAG